MKPLSGAPWLPPDFVQSAYSALGAIRKTLVPRYIRVRISAEEYSNERFAREVGEQVVPGLEYLQKKVGFVEVEVEERGGIFWLLGNRLKTPPHYIAFQYVYQLVRPRNQLRNLSRSAPLNFLMALLLLPVYLVTLPFLGFLIPLLFFYLDRLDRRRLFCLGYACSAKKPIADAGTARNGRETP